MTAVEGWLQRTRRKLLRLGAEPRVRLAAEGMAWTGGGFFLSAASLAASPMPLTLGLIWGAGGWQAVAAALGSILGCRVFWGPAGTQGMVWAALALGIALVPGRKKWAAAPLLMPALAALLVSLTGLVFQMALGDRTPTAVYLLRVALAAAVTGLSAVVRTRREPVADWLAMALGVLALAQVAPVPWLGLGYLAAGLLAAGGSFPAAALAGLALDLARVTRVPMTAALCLACLIRVIPFSRRWPRYAAPGTAYCVMLVLCGIWDPAPAVGLFLGGGLAVLLPGPSQTHRRGETGAAQVRLELMSGVLLETRQILLEEQPTPIDREALLLRTRERACGGCPNRKLCRDITIPDELLDRSLWETTALGIPCKKPGRMLLELRRTQEQLRTLRADRDRRREYREAVSQLYCFLGEFLREQADLLPRRGYIPRPRFSVEAEARSLGREPANGDRFLKFPGTECRYYILLCDGMGTGTGAVQEGKTAIGYLRQLLSCGFPAGHALRSLNSLCALGDRVASVTVDLAEVELDTGKVTLYKWGAGASYLLTTAGAEKLGSICPPPGLSVTEGREVSCSFLMRRGQTLVLVSDGVEEEAVMDACKKTLSAAALAEELLRTASREDDATVVTVQLLYAKP